MKYLTDQEIQRYSESIRKGVDYVLKNQQENGWIQPKEETPEVVLTYNMATMLCQAGELAAARRYVEFISQNMVDPYDGLQKVDQNTVWATHTAYFKGWLVYGCHQLGFYDKSLKLVHTLDRFVNPVTGGVHVTEKGARNRTVTSFFRGAPVAMAMLITGRMDMAHRIGESMLRTVFTQPDPDKFFAYQDGKTGEVITEGELYEPPIFGYENSLNQTPPAYDENEMDPVCFCTDANEDYQAWALYGPPMNFLAGMYDATGDKRYLDANMAIFERFWKNRPHYSTRFICSCKILQALPQIYLATKDERVLVAIRELCDYLVEKQYPEGFWVKDTLQGLGREATPEEQQEWVKPGQIGDCALSIQNVLKWLG